MREILLNTPIRTIKGEQMMADFGDAEKTENILKEIMTSIPVSAEKTFQQIEDWRKRLAATERKPVKVRDYLLSFLGARFDTKSPRERFWAAQMGIEVADEGNEKLKLDDEKFKFLKKLIESNKIKRVNRAGMLEEIELFLPYESGQLLMALGEEPSGEQDLIRSKRRLK